MRSDEIVVGSYHEYISYHRLLTSLVLGELPVQSNRQEEFLASVTCDSAYSSAEESVLESPIGPCVVPHRLDNCRACCVSEKRRAPSQQRNGTTGNNN